VAAKRAETTSTGAAVVQDSSPDVSCRVQISVSSHDSHCRAMRCISAAYAVMRCPSVCLSVCSSFTSVSCVKRIKIFSNFFHHRVAKPAKPLVFPCQTGWRYSDGNPLNGGVECRWSKQKKRDSERISLHTLHTALQCCKPYESRTVKNKAATDGVEPSTHGGVRRRCSHKTTTKCL